MKVSDKPRIYGDGTIRFDDPDDYEDMTQHWSINRSDKDYVTTSWDFLQTRDPSKPLKDLKLPRRSPRSSECSLVRVLHRCAAELPRAAVGDRAGERA